MAGRAAPGSPRAEQKVRWLATLPALRATSPYAGEAFRRGVRIATTSVRAGLAMTFLQGVRWAAGHMGPALQGVIL